MASYICDHKGDVWRFHYFVAKCDCGWLSDAFDGNGGKAEAMKALKEHQEAERANEAENGKID